MGSWFCAADARLTVSSSKRSRRVRDIFLLFRSNLLNEIPEQTTCFLIFGAHNKSEIFAKGLGCHLCVPFI